jgi:hypothetical protein
MQWGRDRTLPLRCVVRARAKQAELVIIMSRKMLQINSGGVSAID